MTRKHRPPLTANICNPRSLKKELLRLCARVGFTPPGDLQP
jgi:hypothetical protein